MIKYNGKAITAIKYNGKSISKVMCNGKQIFPDSYPNKCVLVGFDFKGFGEGGVSINGQKKAILVLPTPDNLSSQSVITYPSDCIAFMDQRYMFDTPFGAQDAMYTHVVYAEYSNGAILYNAIWNAHAPIYFSPISSKGNFINRLELQITSGDIEISTNEPDLGFSITSDSGTVSITASDTNHVLNYNIGNYNSNEGYGSIDKNTRPLLINETDTDLKITITKKSGVSEATLSPFSLSNRNYIRIDQSCFDNWTGKYVNILVSKVVS